MRANLAGESDIVRTSKSIYPASSAATFSILGRIVVMAATLARTNSPPAMVRSPNGSSPNQ